MKKYKKYGYLIIVTLMTTGLGVMSFYTSMKLRQTTPIAPTVPQVVPHASENLCSLAFDIGVTPEPTNPDETPEPTNPD